MSFFLFHPCAKGRRDSKMGTEVLHGDEERRRVFAELLSPPATGVRGSVSNHAITQHLSLHGASPFTEYT